MLVIQENVTHGLHIENPAQVPKEPQSIITNPLGNVRSVHHDSLKLGNGYSSFFKIFFELSST